MCGMTFSAAQTGAKVGVGERYLPKIVGLAAKIETSNEVSPHLLLNRRVTLVAPPLLLHQRNPVRVPPLAHIRAGAEEAGMKGWRECAAGMRNVCRAAFAVVGFLI